MAYIYTINYQDNLKALCEMEMYYLFNCNLEGHLICSDLNYEAGRSIFFKEKMNIYAASSSLETLDIDVSCQDFKVIYLKNREADLSYEKQLEAIQYISCKICGKGDIHSSNLYGVLYEKGIYYFGKVEIDHQSWQKFLHKPQTYSQSLGLQEARCVINIASEGNLDVSLVDPCCGIGTIVLEGLGLNHLIDGYEIHQGVCWKGNRNLEYFGYEKIIHHQDMHTIQKHYDVAILDIPYNLYSNITKEEQQALIASCYRLADRLVLITYEKLDELLGKWVLERECLIKKQKMQRFIQVFRKGDGSSFLKKNMI